MQLWIASGLADAATSGLADFPTSGLSYGFNYLCPRIKLKQLQYLISICVPAYKRTTFLQRLLDSISIQEWKDFEVIVTDDSPGNEVKILCEQYANRFALAYYRNATTLGTPENWNESIRKANGAWIKLMHDDDWFTDAKSLTGYVEGINKHPSTSFFFSAYRDVFLEKNTMADVHVSDFRYRQLRRNPATLFSKNVVGPPSVVIHKKESAPVYDKQLKWVVDIDFYIRYFKKEPPVYLDRICVNVGIGNDQVTRDCFRQRPVEIPENFALLNKTGIRVLRNILVYDAWWRLMRNLEIKKPEEIRDSGYRGAVHAAISSMVSWQRVLPKALLQTGITSKMVMFFNYLFNYHTLRN